MRFKSIDDIVNDKNNNIDYETLRDLLNQRLKELYDEEKKTPLLDYADIQNSAKIDLIYDIMPSLKDEINLEDQQDKPKETIIIKN